MQPDTFILGIDGMPSWLWPRLAAAGVMPFSQKLLADGQLAAMESSLPEVSSAAWASIVTGTNPGGHNVYGFTDLIDGTYTLGFTSSRTFRAKPFWQRDDGRRNLIVNVPQTYPAQPLPGTLISGFVALDLERAVYPETERTLLEECGYRVDADMSTIETSKEAFLADIHAVLDARLAVLDRLWDAESWDTIMFVITGTDRLNHYLWEDYEDTSSPYHQRFLDFYHAVDRGIERIVERLDDSTHLFAVSDHGFGRQEISLNLNRVLSDNGYLTLGKSQRASYIDMTPETRAFAMDPGRIYLHRAGRYPHGQLDDQQASQLESELTAFFTGLEINGQRVVDRVLRGSDIYSGPCASRAPDLILMPTAGVAFSGRIDTQHLIEPTRINGKHTFENSTFFCRTPGPLTLPASLRVEDVLGLVRQVQPAFATA